MNESEENLCFQCGSALGAGALKCPTCEVALVVCTATECGKSFLAALEECPFCFTPNQSDQAVGGFDEVEPRFSAESPAAPDPSLIFPPLNLEAAPSPTAATAEQAGTDLASIIKRMKAGASGAPDVSKKAPESTPPAFPIESGAISQFTAAAPPSNPAASYAPPTLPSFSNPLATTVQPTAPSALAFPAPVPASLTAIYSASSHLDDAGPVGLGLDAGQRHTCGRQSLLRLRLIPTALPTDAAIELTITSGLLREPFIGRVEMSPGQQEELPGIRLLPHVPGSEQIQVAISISARTGRPLGRWTGTWMLTIAQPEAAARAISAGGDVIIMGGPGPGLQMAGALGTSPFGTNPMMAADGLEDWRPVALKADRAFNRRASAACPPDAAAPSLPQDFSSEVSPWSSAAAVLELSNENGAPRAHILISASRKVMLGRGGDSSVAWWLKPAPFDAYQHGRLSRRHATLELRDGLAWLTDTSTNGTLLNQRQLASGKAEYLATGDIVSSGSVIPFDVDLTTRDGQVSAITLARTDALGGRLFYFLIDGRAPVPLRLNGRTSAPSLWIATAIDQNGQLRISAADASGIWTDLAATSDSTPVGGLLLRWRLLPAPIDQDELLARPTAGSRG